VTASPNASRASMFHRPLVLSALALLVGACSSAPAAPIPDPLPETLAWARAEDHGGGGSFLGLDVRENDSGSLEDLEIAPGVRVTRVIEHSPAARAGFQVGDVLLRFGGVEVPDPASLDVLLEGADAGAPIELEARRGDTAFRVPVELESVEGSAPEAEVLWTADPSRSRAAWLRGRGGVVLVASVPDGPFPDAGIEVGSVVTALDGERVVSERALVRNLTAREPGAEVEVTYRPPPAAAGTGEGGDAEEASTDVRLYLPPRRVTDASLPILIGYEASPDGETASFYLLDLWFLSLFEYRREGNERNYSILRFLTFSSGVGELAEGGA